MSALPFGLAVRAVILDDQGRVLLVRRSKANRSAVGQWEWPGGKCDAGEPFDRALAREVLEETGLVVEPTALAGAYELELPTIRVVVLCLRARVTGGRMTLSTEHDETAWAAASELARYDLVASARDFVLAFAARAGGQG